MYVCVYIYIYIYIGVERAARDAPQPGGWTAPPRRAAPNMYIYIYIYILLLLLLLLLLLSLLLLLCIYIYIYIVFVFAHFDVLQGSWSRGLLRYCGFSFQRCLDFLRYCGFSFRISITILRISWDIADSHFWFSFSFA